MIIVVVTEAAMIRVATEAEAGTVGARVVETEVT